MAIKQLGKYTILEELGRGGFGTVYRATDNALDREVALKILHPQLLVDMDFVERFQKEAKLVARLEHPNIVTIYDLGEAEGRVYIAMRYLPGGSLRDRLKKSGRIPFDHAMEILRQVGAGLSAAHARGLVHRDIKPENILFSENGQAVIADFGLAKAIQSSTSSSLGVAGTPGYRAPELWRGKPPAGPATDEYALACVFVEMLTGEQLFSGDTPDEIITKHLVDGAVFPQNWPVGVPQGLNTVLKKALAKDPSVRFPGVDGFVAALEGLGGQAAKQKEASEQRAAEEKGRQEEQTRQKSATEENARKQAEEHERQEADLKARQAAQEQARRDAQEREHKATEQRLAEIARLQPEIEMALAGAEWGKARQLTSNLKNLGPEGQVLAERLRKKLPKPKIPDWAWAVGGLVVLSILIAILWRVSSPPAAPATAAVPTTAAPATAAVPATAAPATAAPAPVAPAVTAAPANAFSEAKCGPNCTYKDMTMCFPQLGAESDWRTADTTSFKDEATKDGFKLVFSDAQQKQENQISAMRACIQQGVSVIALPPVVQDGFDTVLTEAKNAGIPVIIVDRSVSSDPSLYAAHIGSDMVLEGNRAAAEMNKLLPNGGAVLELSGTPGSGAAVGRTQGFKDKLNANIKILDSQTGNFTRVEAIPVMQAFLQKYKPGVDFQGIEIQNDDMGIGVIEALKAAGVKPGDLKIVSFDGTRGGFQAMIDGWFQADVECNPLLGPQVADMALKLMNGQAIDHEVLTNETVYHPDQAAALISSRQY